MLLSYKECISYITAKNKFAVKLGLERMREFCELLGNPQDFLRCIHIAGTNGKGSTSLMIANALQHAGYKVGRLISPSVYEFNERISINNTPIPENRLAEIVSKIALLDNGVSEFEFVTALAFLYFAEENCDFVVLEVGLGGRLDATNIIQKPELCVITAIGYDHMEYLGETLTKITHEKCGIIKEGCRVVVYPEQLAEALVIIKDTSLSLNAEIISVSAGSVLSSSMEGSIFIHDDTEYTISLLGDHQVLNASTAITALNSLSGADITYESLQHALTHSQLPARFEIISKRPYIILDGAHNYGGITALYSSLSQYFHDKKITIIMGMLSTKEYEKCVPELAKLANCFIATKPDTFNALEPSVLQSIAKKYCSKTFVFDNPCDAISFSLDSASSEVICICGSLYLMDGIPNFVKTCL